MANVSLTTPTEIRSVPGRWRRAAEYPALQCDRPSQRFTEQAEQRKRPRFQSNRHADRLSLTSRRRGTTLALQAPGNRPAALAVSRLDFDPESKCRFRVFRDPLQDPRRET